MTTTTHRDIAASACDHYADVLDAISQCEDRYDAPCDCPAHDEPGSANAAHNGIEWQRARDAWESLTGEEASWEPTEVGCYWAHAARIWRDRASVLRQCKP